MQKLRVGILFGGKSAEHEVSLQSARSIINAIDKKKYDVVLIGITKEGKWQVFNQDNYLLNATDPKKIALNIHTNQPSLINSQKYISPFQLQKEKSIDVIFPVVHGPFGEDGSIQGLLKLANIPFVGAGVLGSAIGMDKDVMKRLLKEGGLPIAKFLVKKVQERVTLQEVKNELGSPFFVKPANLGSSIGVSKVTNEEEFKNALALAYSFDTKIIIEEAVKGREVECSVLGNQDPIVSTVGEIIIHDSFYTYNAKYLDKKRSELVIPAELPQNVIKNIQDLAIKTFQLLCCNGMARVDFFVANNNQVFVNEINTIPGFTSISMYPKLWEVSGISYPDLISRLIQLAIERFKNDQALATSF